MVFREEEEIPDENTFIVSFYADDKLIISQEVKEHESATAPSDPTKDGYRFIGWDKEFSDVTSDLSVSALFEEIPVNPTLYYSVKFYDYDKTLLKEETVQSGTGATAPSDPIRRGYTFAGWNKSFNDVRSDLEVTAEYNPNTYTITYRDGSTVIEEISVRFGEMVTIKSISKTNYVFQGWKYNDEMYSQDFVYEFDDSIILVAVWKEIAKTENLVYSGSNVTYRNSSTVVQIPTQYVQSDTQLRAAWVSSMVGSYSPSTNKETMKANLTEVLDVLEFFNMNCIICHIRTHNNAFYRTKLAPIKSNYGTYESMGEWDWLTWFIEECHKRGIQFHAWLNPYRIASNGYSLDATTADVAAQYASYPDNPAHNKDNILLTYSSGTQGAILDPGRVEVQDYITRVCIEVMQNYDVDAIHFDDYFYAQMSASSAVLSEADQDEYVEYIKNNPSCGYSASSADNKKQWRRDNVDQMIYKLHLAMTEFNKKNNRAVQLGIAPTGIYRNGNGNVTYDAKGNAITNGSNTAGQEHYSSYLFCDTLKWINNEWIDYIMPQSYWAFTHRVAGYADVMDWWNAVVRYKSVNLYSGIGIYMSEAYSSSYSWTSENYEVSNQILYTTKLNMCKGVSFYSYNYLMSIYNNSEKVQNLGLHRIKEEYWTYKVACPKTMADYLN